jgi:hypothetical protein
MTYLVVLSCKPLKYLPTVNVKDIQFRITDLRNKEMFYVGDMMKVGISEVSVPGQNVVDALEELEVEGMYIMSTSGELVI